MIGFVAGDETFPGFFKGGRPKHRASEAVQAASGRRFRPFAIGPDKSTRESRKANEIFWEMPR